MLFESILDTLDKKLEGKYPVKNGSSESKFVKCLIEGKVDECPDEKSFLFDIVNNSRNSIDVDKIDYIQRDCRCMNVPYISFNSEFLIKEMRVYNNEQGKPEICFPDKYSNLIN